MRKILGLLLCALFAGDLLHASEALGRKPLVESAYRMFPGLLMNAIEFKSFEKQLSAEEKKVFNKIIDRTKSLLPKLVYIQDSDRFIINPGEDPRLMVTPEEATGEDFIYINETLLQDPSLKIDFVFLLKLFLHEMGHKVGEANIGMRDRLAQLFENHLSSYLKYEKIGSGLELMIFSLPYHKVDVELGKAADDEIHPSTVLMLKKDNNYFDLTPAFLKAMREPTLSMRSIWAELNKAIYAITELVHQMMNQYMKPAMLEGMAIVNHIAGSEVMTQDESFKKMFEIMLRELRLVEIHSLEHEELKDSQFISMKATYAITRTSKDRSSISVNKTPMWELEVGHPLRLQESYLVPMIIQMHIPKNQGVSVTEFNVQLRPQADYSQEAKVDRVTRANGQVSFFKIKFPMDENPKTVKLVAQYGAGQLMLTAQKIEKLADGMYSAEFVIDPEFYRSNKVFIADSILVNVKKALFLDRLVNLSAQDAVRFQPARFKNSLVPGKAGLWGLKKGEVVFASEFDAGLPVNLEFGSGELGFAVNPMQVIMDFELKHQQQIKEVRFHYMRTSTEFTLDGDVDPKTGGRGVKSMTKKETQEIVSVDGRDIESAVTNGGAQASRMTFQIPLELLDRPRAELEALLKAQIGKKEYMFIASPMMLEVVTADLETHRHYFQVNKRPMQKCEEALAQMRQLPTGT